MPIISYSFNCLHNVSKKLRNEFLHVKVRVSSVLLKREPLGSLRRNFKYQERKNHWGKNWEEFEGFGAMPVESKE